MNEQIINPKPKRSYFSIVIWIAIIIFAIFLAKDLIGKYNEKKLKTQPQIQSDSEFSNIEAEIYQTNSGDSKSEILEKKSLNYTEVLLKQQLQISELQNNFHALKMELERIRAGDSLSKIILSFVKLQDLVEQKQNYTPELQKLELLCRADYALSRKIEKLKLSLLTPTKNNPELIKEFVDLTPLLKSKRVEIENKGSWFGKVKAVIARYIIIKKTGEKSESDFEVLITNLEKNIEDKKYDLALQNVDSIGAEYREILASFKIDLQKANDFEQISNEIYKYLELLSN